MTEAWFVVAFTVVLVISLSLSDVLLTINGEKTKHEPKTIIVVGSGLAGMSASLEASRRGSKVILLEKNSGWGGNSKKASSGINAVGTKAQIENNITDSISEFIQDSENSGGGLANPRLVDILARESKESVEFLERLGVDLSVLSQCGGHSRKRTHRSKTDLSIGFAITKKISDALQTENIEIKYGNKVESLIYENGVIKGVEVENKGPLFADSVILASGGFGRSHELLQKYANNIADFPSTNGEWTTGDGVIIAEKVGASLVHMDKVQVHPTAIVNTSDPQAKSKFLAPEALRGSGGILVNPLTSKRFVNELGLRNEVSAKILSECSNSPGALPVALLILPEAAANLFGTSLQSFYVKNKLATEHASLSDLLKFYSLNSDILLQELKEYDEAAAGKQEDKFGKKEFPVLAEPEKAQKWVVFEITPAIHYTMGGLEINEHAQVLSATNKSPIKGLFAAGEVSGGVHGENRLAGNSLLECVVFGRRAGKFASEIDNEGNHLCCQISHFAQKLFHDTNWSTVIYSTIIVIAVDAILYSFIWFKIWFRLAHPKLYQLQQSGIEGEKEVQALFSSKLPTTLAISAMAALWNSFLLFHLNKLLHYTTFSSTFFLGLIVGVGFVVSSISCSLVWEMRPPVLDLIVAVDLILHALISSIGIYFL